MHSDFRRPLAPPAVEPPTALLQPLDAWADAVSRSFVPLHTRAAGGAAATRFRGRLVGQSLGRTKASIVAGSAIAVARTPREIARDDPGFIKVGVQLDGASVITQDGRDAVLRAGDFAVYDTTRPYALRFDGPFRMFVLMFPLDALQVDRGTLREHTATRFAGRRGATADVGALASGFLRSLGDAVDTGGMSDSIALSDAAFDLLIAALSERSTTMGSTAASARRRVLATRVESFIADNLGDPRLTVSRIAAAHHISVRTLQKLFESRGETVSGWIRRRRLEAIRRDLVNPAFVERPLAMVGARWGFSDAAAFSRAFRSAYGMSPSEYRLTTLTH